jgi:HAD superfamily hydrolase (TIGR01509 family)
MASLRLPFSPAALAQYRRINDDLWAQYRRGEIDQSALARERFRRLLAVVDADPRRAAALDESYIRHLSRRGDRLPHCRHTLARLGRRYRLGVVTNGIDRVQRSRLKAAGLRGFFEVVVTSEGCGYVKPDPRILGVALEALAVSPREALYVGDDVSTDGAAADRAGVPFCWMDRGQPLPTGARRPRRRVTSLREIPGLLDGA